MPLVRWVVIALIIGSGLQLASVPIRHVAPSPEDQFLECASRLLGKRTLRAYAAAWVSAQVPCGTDREAFEAALRAKELQVSDAGASLIIHYGKTASDAPTMRFRRYDWTTLRIVPVVEHQRSAASGLPLTDAQVEGIGATVMAVARPVPVGITTRSTEGARLDLALRVTMDRVRLRRDIDSVVSLIGFERTGRLVYGELHGESYTPLWDSPLLESVGGPNLSWTYRDLDGDGVNEILAHGAANPNYETVIAFDLAGNELTRNGECRNVYSGLSNTNPTCPMIGETIRFEPSSPRRPFPLDIVTETRDGTQRFCLRSGRYAPCQKSDR